MSTPYLRGPRLHPYTQTPNSTIRDARLSYRALGVLLRLLSNTDEFRMNSVALSKEGDGREGRDAVRTALRELEDLGYCRRVVGRRDDGTVVGQFVFFYESLEEAKAHSSALDAIGREIVVDENGNPMLDHSSSRGPGNQAPGFPGDGKTRRPNSQARKEIPREKKQRRNKNQKPPTTRSSRKQEKVTAPMPRGGVDPKKTEEAQEAACAGVWWMRMQGKEIESETDLRNHIINRVSTSGLNERDRQQIAAWRSRGEYPQDKPSDTEVYPTLADIERLAKPGETYAAARIRLRRGTVVAQRQAACRQLL